MREMIIAVLAAVMFAAFGTTVNAAKRSQEDIARERLEYVIESVAIGMSASLAFPERFKIFEKSRDGRLSGPFVD
jgi:hypothetical protein|tara:strand:+ start:322 stop:546 length:225 start_codon:yes stop_codon:yes gene_type:complete